MTLRKRIFEIIQPDNGTSKLSRIFDRIITALILTSVVIVFAGTFDLQPCARRVLFVIESIASIVFTIEYVLRIVTADFLYPGSGAFTSRVKYVTSPMAIVDLKIEAFEKERIDRFGIRGRYFDCHIVPSDVFGRTRCAAGGVPQWLLGSMVGGCDAYDRWLRRHISSDRYRTDHGRDHRSLRIGSRSHPVWHNFLRAYGEVFPEQGRRNQIARRNHRPNGQGTRRGAEEDT